MQSLLVVAAALSLGQVALAALCPVVTPMSGFQPARYLNRWYELKRITREFELGGQCATATYTLSPDGYIVVYNRQYIPKFGQYASLIGNATLADNASTEARLLVKFPVTSVVSNYWVIGTDYDHYSVVWSCNNDTVRPDGTTGITVWVLSRERTLANQYLQEVDAILRTNAVDPSILLDIDQTNCPETACAGCPIAQTNFDTSKVSGSWHEVKHSTKATGASSLTCSSAQVSPFPNGVSIAASARDTSSSKDVQNFYAATWQNSNTKNGSFQLKGEGITGYADFCFLGTDYNGYAVVSECIEQGNGNLDTDMPVAGGVYVWSRTPSLTSDQQFQVNTVLVTAGYSASDMVDTPAAPCPTSVTSGPDSSTAATPTQSPSSSWATTGSALLIAICLFINM